MRDRFYDAVIFDLDGTLLDTLQDLTDSVNEILGRYGHPSRSKREVAEFTGNGLSRLLARSVKDGEAAFHFEEMLEEFRNYYGVHCMDETEPYPGIMSLLDQLKKSGFRMAIVSNKADFAVKKLNAVYFDGMIDAAIGERDGCRRKPEPDAVFQALEELQVPPERAVYIGDSEVDLETARRAGIDAILVTWGFRSRQDLLAKGAPAERMASNVRELAQLLGR